MSRPSILSLGIVAPSHRTFSATDNTPCSYSHIPVLTRENYLNWQFSVKAYLTPGNHVRIVRRTMGAGGILLDSMTLTDVVKLEKWIRS